MNLLLYRFFRTQIYGILMFYIKDCQKQHRKRNLVAWRLMALVWILDIIILYKGSSYFPISYFAEPIVFFVVCFVVVPCFWEVSTCPACGRRIFFRPLVSGHCPKCKSKLILFSQYLKCDCAGKSVTETACTVKKGKPAIYNVQSSPSFIVFIIRLP